MKPDYRSPASLRMLLVINLVVFATSALNAQCPAGSIVNPGSSSTFNAGQTVCITNSSNTPINLNSGANLVIINGGNYTGNFVANSGSTVTVQAGGTFAASPVNHFAAALSNNGTVNVGNVSVQPGASFTNNGTFTVTGNLNAGSNAMTFTNTACGAMTWSNNTTLSSAHNFTNDGIMNFSQGFSVNSGASFINRGRLNVNGDGTLSGYFRNENVAVFRGNNNNNSSNTAGDSIVNLGKMTWSNNMTSSIAIRNEGLLWVNGTYTLNGGILRINNSNAQVRVGSGGLNNNGQISGNGSFYIAGNINSNNQTIRGYGPGTQRLVINKTAAQIPGNTANWSDLNHNTSLAAADTGTYVAAYATPASCAVLPVRLSALQAVYHNNQVQLNWLAYEQSNARSFTIEYSQDGRTFTKAGDLTAATNNTTTTPYQFTHATVATGTLYYRIRENAVDGITYYSNTVVVKTGALLIATEVFPNPFKDMLQISMQLEKAGVIQVALYNTSGQVVRTLQKQGLTGRNIIPLGNLSALPTGTYLLQVKAGEHTSFGKVIK